MREAKKCKSIKTGSGASKKSTYIHFKRLSFLHTLIGQKDTTSNFSTEVEGLDRSTSPETNSTFRSCNVTEHTKASNKRKLHAADKRFSDILEQSLNQKQLANKVENDDELFCLWLKR
jgi:hypothetical protein